MSERDIVDDLDSWNGHLDHELYADEARTLAKASDEILRLRAQVDHLSRRAQESEASEILALRNNKRLRAQLAALLRVKEAAVNALDVMHESRPCAELRDAVNAYDKEHPDAK